MKFFEEVQPFHYRYYDPKKKVHGKTMEEHLRIAVCFWHTFCWPGVDPFGLPVFRRPWLNSPENKILAGFEFVEKMGLKYFTFHDVDVAPPGTSLKKIAEQIHREMERTKIELLWGTANLTGHPRYMSGASTNPDMEVFACACAQVKEAMDITHQLKGHNYVLWGGREGYETVLNTDIRQELEQYARFLSMLAEYKHKIGFKGVLLIEPKPCEPMKHMYDFDCANAYAFLQKYGLEKEYKFNIENNHATLAGHTLAHEVAYSIAHEIFGSIDANDGDLLLGWDTDQFPMDVPQYTQALYYILQNGGMAPGGFNIDAKVRRQSIDLQDLVYGHGYAVDTLAKSRLAAEALIQKGQLPGFVKERYKSWHTPLGQKMLRGEMSLEEVARYAEEKQLDPQPRSGRQEWLDGLVHA